MRPQTLSPSFFCFDLQLLVVHGFGGGYASGPESQVVLKCSYQQGTGGGETKAVKCTRGVVLWI